MPSARTRLEEREHRSGDERRHAYDSAPSTGNYQPALDKLRRSLLTTFPQLEGVRFSHAWGGTMGFTLDFLPAIGTLEDAKNVFYAVGFNGEGVVMTQLAGQIVTQLIAGEDTPLTKLPDRRPDAPLRRPRATAVPGSEAHGVRLEADERQPGSLARPQPLAAGNHGRDPEGLTAAGIPVTLRPAKAPGRELQSSAA